MFLVQLQHLFGLLPQVCSKLFRLQYLHPAAKAQNPLPHIGTAGKIPFKQEATLRLSLKAVRPVLLNKAVLLALLKQRPEVYSGL